MKELKTKIGAYYEARQAMMDAERDAIGAIAEMVAENGDTFCGDIAEATGIPSCVLRSSGSFVRFPMITILFILRHSPFRLF